MWYAAKGGFQIYNGALHRKNDNTLTGKRAFRLKNLTKSMNISAFTQKPYRNCSKTINSPEKPENHAI
jgi:hypothetical protein